MLLTLAFRVVWVWFRKVVLVAYVCFGVTRFDTIGYKDSGKITRLFAES